MINIASHATHDVKIPNWQQTCEDIIEIFKKQMSALKEWLNVSWISWALYAQAPILIRIQSDSTDSEHILTMQKFEHYMVSSLFWSYSDHILTNAK